MRGLSTIRPVSFVRDPPGSYHSQGIGFTEIEFPVDRADDETFKSWLERAGFGAKPAYAEGSAWGGMGLAVYSRGPNAAEQSHDYAYFICLDEQAETLPFIFVKSRLDHLALRVALAPMIASSLTESLEHFVKMVGGKAFHLEHGHEWYTPCEECDPLAVQFNALHEAKRGKN